MSDIVTTSNEPEEMAEALDLNIEFIDEVSAHVKATFKEKLINESLKQSRDQVRSQVKIPGFRPGRAPDRIIDLRFRDYLIHQLSEQLNIYLVRHPEYQKYTWTHTYLNPTAPEWPEKIADLKTVSLEFDAERLPDVELPDLSTLKVDVERPEVTEEMIQAQLEQMRSGMSQYVEVEATENEDGETVEVTVQADDLVLVNFEVVSGDEDIDVEDLPPKDKRLLKQKNNWIYLGENEYLPGLNKQLIGCKLNDAKDVVIEFPEDFAVEPLRGKKLTYEFEIQRVRRLQLPELDDEFAKAQNCESMEELRDRVRQQLEEQINNQYEQDLNQAIIDKVVENVPEFKIGANTLRDARERVTPRLRSQNPKKEDEDNAAYEERLNALIEEEAVKEAREWIVIQNIINKHKIQPDVEKFYEYHHILSQYQEMINARQGGGRSPMHDQRLQSQAMQGAMLHALYRFLRQQMGLETEEETEQAAADEEKTDEEQEQSEQSE